MDTQFAVPSSTPIEDRLSDLNPPIWEIDGSPNLGVFTTPRARSIRMKPPFAVTGPLSLASAQKAP